MIVCLYSARLASGHTADPHSLLMAADVRHGHAQPQPPCAVQLPAGLRQQHPTEHQLEVGTPSTPTPIALYSRLFLYKMLLY